MTFAFNDVPRFTESRIRKPKVKGYQPGPLRACERLALIGALEVQAEYDADGIDTDRITYRERGECVVMRDGVIVAVVVGLTDESGPPIETITHDFRERLRRVTTELDGESGNA